MVFQNKTIVEKTVRKGNNLLGIRVRCSVIKFVKNLLNSGVDETVDQLLEKKIVLTNGISLFIGLCSIPFIFIFYIHGSRLFGGATVINVALFFSVTYFNKRRDFNIARHILLLTWGVGVFLYTLFLGKDTALQNCFFSLVAVPFLLFLPTERIRLAHLIIPTISYFLVEYNFHPEVEQIELSEYSNAIISRFINPTVLLQIIIVLYFASIHEKGLIRGKNEAIIIKDSLDKQRNFLVKKLNNLEKKEADLATLLSSLDDIVLEVDSDGLIREYWTNDNELEIEQSTKVSEYFGLLMQKKIEHAFDRFGNDYQNKIHEYVFKQRVYQFKITPLHRRGKIERAAIIVRDITISKKLQEEYNDFKKEKEVEDRSEEFKESFLANMSHEIRTPLNGVVGVIDLLNDTELSKVQGEYVDILKSSSNNLLGLINDILDLSKIEAGKVVVQSKRFNVHRLISNLVELFRPMATSSGLFLCVEMESEVPKYVVGDPTKISQVLSNLISNAVKFTVDGGVTIKVDLIGDNNLRFEIEDTGIGIPKESQKVLFKKFTQLHRGNSSIKGTGLGLSIVKELVAIMGGEISIKPDTEIGATFIFSVTFQNTHQEDSDEGNQKEQISSMKVLLVDDISVNRKVANMMLTKLKCEVVEAVNGLEAVELVKNENFDLVLMDIQMPIMNGVEALNEIRKLEVKIPVVALSANALEGDKEKYLKLGFNDYLSKPITLKSLKSNLIKY